MAKSHKTCMEQAEIIDTFGTYHGPANVTPQQCVSSTHLRSAFSSLQAFSYYFKKIFYSHWEYLYSSSGAPSPRSQRCAQVITRTSRNNILLEFGCSLTPKTVNHSSDH